MKSSSSPILSAQSGRAQSIALMVLGVLASFQLLWLLRALWLAGVASSEPQKLRLGNAGETRAGQSTVLQERGYLVPPVPGQLADGRGSAAAAARSAPAWDVPMPGQLANPSAAVGAAGEGGVSAAPRRLDPEVEAGLEMVRQIRQDGDTAEVLSALQALDGMAQNEPEVLLEFALTYEQMGLNDRALTYWQRIQALGAQLGGNSYATAMQRLRSQSGNVPPEFVSPSPLSVGASLPSAEEKGRQIAADAVMDIGVCEVIKDPAVIDGDRRTLRIPLLSLGREKIQPGDVNLDVFFFDIVNGKEVEETRANQPVYIWPAEPVDWADESELLDVTYFLPPFSEEEKRNFGERGYYGYVVKLYYKNRFQAAVAEPTDLLQTEAGGEAR